MWRPDPKPLKVKKQPKPLNKVKEKTGEAEMFAEIWKEREHKSQVSGTPIYYPRPANFAHILRKAANAYPRFKLYKKAVWILTEDEHFEYDNGLHSELRELPEWKNLFLLRDELLQEYKKLI